jgi:uncharacterized metal-binding protein
MPSGNTHDMLTITTGILAIPVMGVVLEPSPQSIGLIMTAVSAHFISGLACSPDMDTQSIVYYRWGFLRWIWYPYQVLIPHRNRISHGLLLGPLFRLFYLGLVGWIMLSLLASTSAQAASWWQAMREWSGGRYFVAGWCTGSMLHSLADIVVSSLKSKSNKHWKRRPAQKRHQKRTR